MGLFAEWNHEALLQHAQQLARALSAGSATAISKDAASSSAKPPHMQLLLASSDSVPSEGLVTPHMGHLELTQPVLAPDSCSSGTGGGNISTEGLEKQGLATSSDTMQPDAHFGGPTNNGEAEHNQIIQATPAHSRAELPSSACAPGLPCSDISCGLSDALDCIVDSVSQSGSAEPAKEGATLTECISEPCVQATQQPMHGHAQLAQHVSQTLWALLKGVVCPAMAVAVLAAVHAGATSLGLAAGLPKMPWPLYLIGTRDSFTHHLHADQRRVSPFSLLCFERWP